MKKILPGALPLLAFAAVAHAAPPEAPTPERERNNFISVGPAYARFDYKVNGVKAGASDPRDFGGVVVNYGRYFGESSVGVHEIGAQAAILGSTDKTNSTRTTLVEAPLVAAYNYNFKLGDTTRLYLGPRAGFTVLGLAVRNDPANFDQADSDLAAKFGAGIGIKQQFTKRFGMAVGYEYSRITDTNFRLEDSGTTLNAKLTDMSSHLVVVSAAWTF